MLQIQHINKSYNTHKIIKNFSIDLVRWNFLGIFWPSWIGKTTLLKMIWWLNKPDSWDLLWKWKSIYKLKKWDLLKYRWTTVWFIFQDLNLLEDLTVKENLNLPFIIWKNKQDPQWLRYLINYLEIEYLLDKVVKSLSGWQQERVCITRALSHKPNILLADEPGWSLDQDLKNKTYNLLTEYSKSNILITASHDLDLQKFVTHSCFLS